jgi:aminoglycoside phosphotransferase (APT) family kinase protein
MFDMQEFRERLEKFLTEKTGTSSQITKMIPLAGGASRDSRIIEAIIDGIPYKLVLRLDLPTTMNQSALSRAQEYHLMRTAYQAGVKVAQVRWLCDESEGDDLKAYLGQPFFLMDFVEGISIGRKVITMPELTHARSVLPEQMAEQLALIHTIDPDKNGLNFLPVPRDPNPIQEAITNTYEVLDRLGVHIPAVEFALRWCQQHQPSVERVTFLHGDFRIGNLLVDSNGLASVIDWEFAHIGDPVEEIGYLCMRDWRFGNDHLRAGGLCDRERLITAYEHFSGHSVNRQTADWWEIIGNIRWGVICLAQAERHLSGQDTSVELASLGRRSAEMQLEALRLIEKTGM